MNHHSQCCSGQRCHRGLPRASLRIGVFHRFLYSCREPAHEGKFPCSLFTARVSELPEKYRLLPCFAAGKELLMHFKQWVETSKHKCALIPSLPGSCRI